MATGILETIGRVGTVVVVAPIVVLALDFLARGNLLGGVAFLGIVGLILAVERYVLTPGDLLQRSLSRLGGAVVKTDGSEDD